MNLYETLTRMKVSNVRSRLGDIILYTDKVNASGDVEERHIVMFTPSVKVQKLALVDE